MSNSTATKEFVGKDTTADDEVISSIVVPQDIGMEWDSIEECEAGAYMMNQIAENPEFEKRIRQGFEEIERGDTCSHKDVFGHDL